MSDKELAEALVMLAGVLRRVLPEKGFALFVFDFGKTAGERAKWITNGQVDDVKEALSIWLEDGRGTETRTLRTDPKSH